MTTLICMQNQSEIAPCDWLSDRGVGCNHYTSAGSVRSNHWCMKEPFLLFNAICLHKASFLLFFIFAMKLLFVKKCYLTGSLKEVFEIVFPSQTIYIYIYYTVSVSSLAQHYIYAASRSAGKQPLVIMMLCCDILYVK